MTAPSVIVILEKDFEAGWAWLQNEARDVWNAVSGIVQHAWAALETNVLQQLWSAAAALAQKAAAVFAGGMNLADLETAFLNTIQTLGIGLLNAAIAVGSNALQAVLGVLQAKAAQAVPAAG